MADGQNEARLDEFAAELLLAKVEMMAASVARMMDQAQAMQAIVEEMEVIVELRVNDAMAELDETSLPVSAA